MSLVSDLLKGPGNKSWELARFMSAGSFTSYTGAFIYALAWKGAVPDWTALGVGYAAVLAGAGAMIGLKDIAVAKANATPPTEPKP